MTELEGTADIANAFNAAGFGGRFAHKAAQKHYSPGLRNVSVGEHAASGIPVGGCHGASRGGARPDDFLYEKICSVKGRAACTRPRFAP